MDYLNAILAAFSGKQWVLLAALLVMGLVGLAKQGWLSTWLAAKIPKQALPYLAVVLGAVGLTATEVVAGKPIAQALVDGLQSGVLAVFGHETIVEGMRNGKELFAKRAPVNDDGPKSAA